MIVLRVVIRSPNRETFIQKYSRFVKDDRIFIFTKSSQPPGTRMRFSLELAEGEPLLYGEGIVIRTRPDTGDAARPPGMELQFAPLDEQSREVADAMRAARTERSSSIGTLPAPLHAPPVRGWTLPPPPLRAGATGPNAISALWGPIEESRPSTEERVTEVHPPRAVDLFNSVPTGPSPLATPLPAPLPQGGWIADRSSPDSDSDEPTIDFASLGPAPPFAERWRTGSPGMPAAPPGSTPLPANPFSAVSDTAIEYFVEWSLENSTAPRSQAKPPDAARFADAKMAMPKRERFIRRWQLLLAGAAAGLAVGVAIGLPIGARLDRSPLAERTEPTPKRAVRPSGAMALTGTPAPARAPRAPAAVEKAVPATSAPATSVPATVAPAVRTPEPRPPTTTAPATSATAPATSATAPAASGGDTALRVRTHPAGASVSIDGVARGTTPLSVELDRGRHSVELTKERYQSQTSTVEAPGRLDVTLKRPAATLRVTSTPPGGEVRIDGDPRGKTPLQLTLDAFERYQVEVDVPGARPFRKRVYVRAPATDVSANEHRRR